MIKILWIDDDLDNDLTEKRMALFMELDFDPHFARDATEAYYRLRNETFDVVIFDIRLPSGADDMWLNSRAQESGKFGVELLIRISNGLNDEFSQLRNSRFGVFSIEAPEENPELFLAPVSLPPTRFMKKTDVYYEEDFISFIRVIAAA